MFRLAMPLPFNIGETAPATITQQPATVYWRDARYLVINDSEEGACCIYDTYEVNGMRAFVCGDPVRWPDGTWGDWARRDEA
jgi:hypothetical protein